MFAGNGEGLIANQITGNLDMHHWLFLAGKSLHGNVDNSVLCINCYDLFAFKQIQSSVQRIEFFFGSVEKKL